MFCKKCGKQMEDNWSICPECGEPVNESNGGNVVKNADIKKKKAPIFKRWWFWIIIVVLGSLFIFGVGDESESNDNTSNTKPESAEVADAGNTDAVEIYEWIAENDDPAFTISEKSINFIKEHPDFFPGSENIEGAISDFVDEEITYAHLTKSMSKYGDKLISIYGEVIDIEESEGGEITYIHILDYDGNSYVLYYLGTLDNVLEETYVYAYALPFAITSFENMEATYTEAVIGAACYVGELVS